MTVYKCPVCEGKGFVCHGFYNSTINYNAKNNTGSSNQMRPETCQSCKGSGIIYFATPNPETIKFGPPNKPGIIEFNVQEPKND